MRDRVSLGMASSGCLGSGERLLPRVSCLHHHGFAPGCRDACVVPAQQSMVPFKLESILWFWGFLAPCHLPLMRS